MIVIATGIIHLSSLVIRVLKTIPMEKKVNGLGKDIYYSKKCFERDSRKAYIGALSATICLT